MFFKKRAVLEDEYGRNMHKLARSTSDAYSMGDGKAGYCTNKFATVTKLTRLPEHLSPLGNLP